MKALRLTLTTAGLVIVLTLVGGLFFLNHVKTKALPDYAATLDIDNLTEEVTVYRDQYAIPHVYA